MKFAVDLRLAEPTRKRASFIQAVVAAPDGITAMHQAIASHQRPGIVVSAHCATPLPLEDDTPVSEPVELVAPPVEPVIASRAGPPSLTMADLEGVSENIRPPLEDEDGYVETNRALAEYAHQNHPNLESMTKLMAAVPGELVPKRKGWPKGKPRGPRKAKAATDAT